MVHQKDGPGRSGLIELGSTVQNDLDYVYLAFHQMLSSALEAPDDGAADVHGVAVGGTWPLAELFADVAALASGPSVL
jgi:hypothetical protein